MGRTLFTDADNTLWDTNAIYEAAQRGLLREVERICGTQAPAGSDKGLGYLRAIDDRIVELHPARQRYSPSILARALRLALSGETSEHAVDQALLGEKTPDPSFAEPVARFTDMIRAIPDLRLGVPEAFSALRAQAVPIVVVTESTRSQCIATLKAHALESFVTVVSGRKTVELYVSLRPAGARPMMVGDQLDCDVAFSHQAGYETVFYAGGYQPRRPAGVTIEPDHRIDRYDDVVPLLNGG